MIIKILQNVEQTSFDLGFVIFSHSQVTEYHPQGRIFKKYNPNWRHPITGRMTFSYQSTTP